MRHAAVAAAAVLCLATPSLPETFQVGPGRPYANLQAVEDLLDPGDIVEVDGNATYPGGVFFTRPGTPAQKIVIRGLRIDGKRPVLSGGTNTVTFASDPAGGTQGGAHHYVFESFEVTGGSFRCLYHQADDLTVRDVLVHHCPAHGILGADQGSGSCLLDRVEVHHCGSGTSQHQIYMATDEVNHPGSVFRMQYCYIHDATGGNNVKSRAERNEIFYNWIEGALYHELELIGPDPFGAPDGWTEGMVREDSDVVGNVLLKRNSFNITRIGGDATGQSNGRYRFVNNTIIAGTSAVFRIFDGIQSVEMHNNVIHRADGGAVNVTRQVEAVWTNGQQISGSGNWVTQGSTNIPAAWIGTKTGSAPGFVDLAGNDLRPAAGSPLLNTANLAPVTPPGFPFLLPHFPPGFNPPAHVVPAAPAGRTDDCGLDIGAYERPPLVANVSGLVLSDDTTLAWQPSPGATAYDVIKGNMLALRSSGGDFGVSLDACLEDDGTDTTSQDPGTPPLRDAFFYLVRPAPAGTDDSPCPDLAAPRDAAIAGSPQACP